MTTEATASVLVAMSKRAYGTGTLYEKDGAWWGRWRTLAGRARSDGGGDGRALVAKLRAQGRKPSTLESVEGHLHAHIKPLLGDLPVSGVEERDVVRLVDHLVRAGRAPKTIRNVLGTMQSLMDLALRDGLIAHNPCRFA